jgi:hypothetical protein
MLVAIHAPRRMQSIAVVTLEIHPGSSEMDELRSCERQPAVGARISRSAKICVTLSYLYGSYPRLDTLSLAGMAGFTAPAGAGVEQAQQRTEAPERHREGELAGGRESGRVPQATGVDPAPAKRDPVCAWHAAAMTEA